MEVAPVERVGQQVDRLRTRFGIGMKDFAAAVDVPFDVLWRLEQHPSAVIEREALLRIAAKFVELGASDADVALIRAEIETVNRSEREAKANEWLQKPGMRLIALGLALTLGAPLVATVSTWNLASGSISGFQRELVEEIGLPLIRVAFLAGPVLLGIGVLRWVVAKVSANREHSGR
jgi:hypothetical protein